MSQCKLKYENPTRLTRSKLSAYKKDQCYYLVWFVFNLLSRIWLGCKTLRLELFVFVLRRRCREQTSLLLSSFKADDREKLYRYEWEKDGWYLLHIIHIHINFQQFNLMHVDLVATKIWQTKSVTQEVLQISLCQKKGNKQKK